MDKTTVIENMANHWHPSVVLIDYLDHLIDLGGIGENDVEGSKHQSIEEARIDTIEAWVNGSRIINGHYETVYIMRTLMNRLSTLRSLAIFDRTKEKLKAMIDKLADDYKVESLVSAELESEEDLPEPVAREGVAFTANWVDPGNSRVLVAEVDPSQVEIIEPEKKSPSPRLRNFFDTQQFAHPVSEPDKS
ncbi:hypothetical protein A2258_01455 [Candidatus Uhrbacteria bacterium RIFOXYA2_FULL_41_8]|nr:MAG: hypothetical protein A2258_01455 [Candidatus Uhrbacteria bacterium RIFOXYA2_FULL_41_8]